MCSTAQNFANTGATTISTSNPALNGSGPAGTVFISGDATSPCDGSRITSITIKSTGNTSEGMVRLFRNSVLYQEVYIPAATQTSVEPAFCAVVNTSIDLNLGDSITATTQNSDTFNVVANGYDWKNCNCSDDCAVQTLYTANTGMVNISTANPNLNGTGSLGTIVAAPVSISAGGTQIANVTIKATGNTTQGMVRLFVDNGIGVFLIREIPIPSVVQTGVEPAYRAEVTLNLYLRPGYRLLASTQNSESFNVFAPASDWSMCSC